MSLAARLKHETRIAHEHIEAAFDLDARLASPAAYRDLLSRLRTVHEAFEAAAAPHLAGTGFARIGRADALRRDLAILPAHPGESRDPSPALDPGFRRDERLELGSRAEALGALYVIEGSVLGGVLIAREAERRLGIGPRNGGAFFAGSGRDTARLWRDFAARLDALADPAEAEVSVAAANRTFAFMEAVLGAPAAHPGGSRDPGSDIDPGFRRDERRAGAAA